MALDKLTTIYSQHSVFLQRVGAGLGNDSEKYLKAIDTYILDLFQQYRDRNLTPKLEQRIKDSINKFTREQLQLYTCLLYTSDAADE